MSGKMQVNFFSPFEGLEYPFLDFMKSATGGFATTSLEPTTDQWAQLNDNGFPQSGSGWVAGINVYFRSATDVLVITWNSATVTYTLGSPAAGFTLTEITVNRTSTRREYNLTNASANFGDSCSIQVSASGTLDNTTTKLQCFYETFEISLNAGERFDPNFLTRYSGLGRIRFMDWMATNSSVAARWGDRVQSSEMQAFGRRVRVKNYCGYIQHDSANDFSGSIGGPQGWVDDSGNPISSPSSWTNGQMVQIATRYIPVTAATNTTNPSFTATAHGLTTGDVIVPTSWAGGTWGNAYNGRSCDVAVVDANTLQLTSVDTGAAIDGTSLGTFSGTFHACVGITGRALLVTAFTNATSLPKVTVSAPHNFSIGDVLTFPGNNTGTFSSKTTINLFKVAALDVSDPTHAFTITYADGTAVDSSGWGTYVSGGRVSKQIRFKCGSLPYKPVLTISMENASAGEVATTSDFGGSHWNIRQFTYNALCDGLISVNMDSGSINYSCNYEMLIALCNELNASPWFCIPMLADDNFVTNFATLVKNNLNSNLIPAFELSNECWNNAAGFNQTFQAQRLSALLWTSQGTQFGDYQQYYGCRFYQVMAGIDAVYAGSGLSYERVMGIPPQDFGAGGFDNRYNAPLATAAATIPASPSTKVDSIAIAPYFDWAVSTVPSLQQAWNYIYGTTAQQTTAMQYLAGQAEDSGSSNGFTFKNLRNTYFPFWAAQATRVAGFGSKTVVWRMYEGGVSTNLNAANSTIGYPGSFDGGDGRGSLSISIAQKNQFLFDFFRSYYFAEGYARSYFQDAIANGCAMPSQYVTATNWGSTSNSGQFNIFGAISPNGFGTKAEYWNWLIQFNQGKRRLILKT